MPVSELFQPVNPAFTQKEIDPVWKNGNFCYLSMIKFQEKKIYRFEWSNYSNLLELSYNTKSSALWLLQRYKSCYSRAGINHKHLARKGLLARRDERSGTSQISSCIIQRHFFFSLTGEPLKPTSRVWHHQTAKASDTASTISQPGTRRPEWISLEKQGRRLV